MNGGIPFARFIQDRSLGRKTELLKNPTKTTPPAVAIVQARMGSNRLPGKMMADLNGHPLIWHILQRAQQIHPEIPVVLATTDLEHDQVLALVAEKLGLAVVRGSQDDVMSRFLLALESSPAPYVIRVCGDSPLFDPGFLLRCLELARNEKADVVKFRGGGVSLFQGGEVISASALKFSRHQAPDDPLSREHVSAWALRNADLYPQVLKTAYLDPEPGMMKATKLSIDTQQDLERLQSLYRELHDDTTDPEAIVDLRQAAHWIQKNGWGS